MDPELRVRVRGRDDLADVPAYRAPQIDAPVKLNTNESPYDPPLSFARELGDRIATMRLNRYPDRDATELRQSLAAHVGVLTDHVWVANGSNELLLQLLLAFGGSERKVMTFEPTYSMHSHVTHVSGTRLLRGRRNPDYTLNLEATIEAIASQKPDVLFLCSPNNPTGDSIDAPTLDAISAVAPGLIILDEAYAEFSEKSFVPSVQEHDRVVVTRSFSKAWRLAGVRLGYLVAQPWVTEELQKVRLPYHLSSLTQAAGLTALNHAKEILGTVETIRHERDRLYAELSTTRGITAFPSDANFILFRCDAKDGKEVWQSLLDRGVLIRDFSDVPGCEGCLRVSVGTPEEDERFLDALQEAIKG